jgi:hypothetical protein
MPFSTIRLNDGRDIPEIGFGSWKLGNGQQVGPPALHLLPIHLPSPLDRPPGPHRADGSKDQDRLTPRISGISRSRTRSSRPWTLDSSTSTLPRSVHSRLITLGPQRSVPHEVLPELTTLALAGLPQRGGGWHRAQGVWSRPRGRLVRRLAQAIAECLLPRADSPRTPFQGHFQMVRRMAR